MHILLPVPFILSQGCNHLTSPVSLKGMMSNGIYLY